jgi:hypothetical protein
MTLVVLLAAAAVVAVGGYARFSARAARSRERHSCRCPRCDKKFRYPEKFAGLVVPCPACKRPITLQAVEQHAPGAGRRLGGYKLRRKAPAVVCQLRQWG